MSKWSNSNFIAFGPNVWGKATTETEATKNMVKAGGNRKDYDVFICHPETTVSDLGDFSYPSGKTFGMNAPIKIKKVRGGKELPLD